MSFLPLLLEFFLKSKRPVASGNMVARGLGFFLLIMGGIFALYQVFQILVPELGHRESQLVLGALLLGGGALLLFIGRPKIQPNPMHEVMETTTNTLKNLDLGSLITKNSSQIIVMALVAGFVLSQIGSVGTSKRLR